MNFGNQIQLYPKILYVDLSDSLTNQISQPAIRRDVANEGDILWRVTRLNVCWQILETLDNAPLGNAPL